MNTIVCPIDFSAGSNNALEFAIGIAHRHQAKLILLHYVTAKSKVFELSLSGHTDHSNENEQEESDSMLAAISDTIKRDGVNCEAYNLKGKWEDLPLLMKEKLHHPDLLVMGTNGSNEHDPNSIAKKIDHLIREIKIPILAIPQHIKYKALTKIVYGTDFAFTDLDSIQNMIDIVSPYSPEVTLLHVSTEKKEEEHDKETLKMFDEVEERFTHYAMKYKVVVDKNIHSTLESYTKSIEAEWLCVSTHNRSYIDNWFSHSSTHVLLHNHNVPLLIFHMHKY